MVSSFGKNSGRRYRLSVLALSSRFDGLLVNGKEFLTLSLSVLALSSRFDGPPAHGMTTRDYRPFSTRSVESF